MCTLTGEKTSSNGESSSAIFSIHFIQLTWSHWPDPRSGSKVGDVKLDAFPVLSKMQNQKQDH